MPQTQIKNKRGKGKIYINHLKTTTTTPPVYKHIKISFGLNLSATSPPYIDLINLRRSQPHVKFIKLISAKYELVEESTCFFISSL